MTFRNIYRLILGKTHDPRSKIYRSHGAAIDSCLIAGAEYDGMLASSHFIGDVARASQLRLGFRFRWISFTVSILSDDV